MDARSLGGGRRSGAGVLSLSEGEGEDGVGAGGLGVHVGGVCLAEGRSLSEIAERTWLAPQRASAKRGAYFMTSAALVTLTSLRDRKSVV